MDGLATIRQRELYACTCWEGPETDCPVHDMPSDEPLKIPNERVRQIIARLIEDVSTYNETSGHVFVDGAYSITGTAVELATFRGAFLALAWSSDPDAQRFAEKGLLALNSGGRQGLEKALESIT